MKNFFKNLAPRTVLTIQISAFVGWMHTPFSLPRKIARLPKHVQDSISHTGSKRLVKFWRLASSPLACFDMRHHLGVYFQMLPDTSFLLWGQEWTQQLLRCNSETPLLCPTMSETNPIEASHNFRAQKTMQTFLHSLEHGILTVFRYCSYI